ncbi:hypothetical protein Shyhy02_39640 [Streptomyces hygroscopicus subsp. hygroscopicus]|nr:hypothetical protein Shyhy02_39640 [Streptomyces hygroscopicus subsp. hygroscopicus]
MAACRPRTHLLIVVFIREFCTSFRFLAHPDAYRTRAVEVAMNAVTEVTEQLLLPDVIQVGSSPIYAAVSPNGQRVYVTNFGSGSVSVIDTATHTVRTTIAVPAGPWGIAIAPDGLHAYVAAFGNSHVVVIDTATNTVTQDITGLNKPLGLAVTPDGSRVYVASQGGNRVDVISTATNTVTASVPVGIGPRNLAITPDGAEVYVTEEGTNTVRVIDTATNTVTAVLTGFTFPRGVAVSPDGQRVYVTDYGGDQLDVIDTSIHAVVDTYTGLSIPFGVAVTSDGLLAYVACDGNDSVAVLDLIARKTLTRVPGFHAPYWLAITPDNSEIYVTNNGNETVQVITAPAGVYPNVGPMSGGIPVTITGEGLGNTTAVRFGCLPAASFRIINDHQIRAVSPLFVSDVKIDVTLGQNTTRTVGRFYYLQDSVMTGISRTSGPLSGGDTLTVTGRGLITTTEVRFGNVSVTPSTLLDDRLTVTVPPAQAPGPVPVTVVTKSNAYGRAVYTYTNPPGISSVTPTSGPTSGGTPVLIEGTALAFTQTVTIGGTQADFGIISATRVAAVTPPAAAPGPADVVVTTTSGTATAPGAFLYT